MKITYVKHSGVMSEYAPHRHSDWEVVTSVQGTMKVKAGSKTFDMKAGDVLIIPPHTVHQGFDGVNYVDLCINADLDGFPNESIKIHDTDSGILTLLLMVRRVVSEEEANYENIANRLLEAITEYLRRHVTNPYKYEFVYEIKDRIYKNLSNPDFDVSREIKKIGFNTDYFRRCFREETGMTPLEYITKLRINEARELLIRSTFKSVEAVSELCGFNDCFYFSKVFKKHTGYSPRDYRKKHVK